MSVHACTCIWLVSVTEVQEPNRSEAAWLLNPDRMSVSDLSLWPYLCTSVCLRSINLQKRFNQEQHPTIIFVPSNPPTPPAPPQGIIFKYYPILLSLLPRTNDMRKLNRGAPLFSAGHISCSCAFCLQGVSRDVRDDWIYHLSVERQALAQWNLRSIFFSPNHF